MPRTRRPPTPPATGRRGVQHPPSRWPVRRWIVACTVAETVGMTAAAAAARGAGGLAAPLALTVVVAGGLVEGTALGWLQGRALGPVLPGVRGRWLLATLLVAGVGWAAASAPAVLAGDDPTAAEPPRLLVLAGAAALGAAMGAVLGAAQGWALRGRVAHPWRWVAVSVAAWTPAMAVVFAGATMPGADWSAPAVVVSGTVTGLAAGAVLGLVSGCLLPVLDGARVQSAVVLMVLTLPGPVLKGSLLGVRVTGRRSGRRHELPVMYAERGDRLLVVPGRWHDKQWWRNLREPAEAAVLRDGRWRPAGGRLLLPAAPGYVEARAAYLRRWPRMDLPDDQPIVELRPAP